MALIFATAVLSVCCLSAMSAPQTLPWQKVNAPVYRNTDDVLHFEPSLTSIDRVWEAFKTKHGMELFVCLDLDSY